MFILCVVTFLPETFVLFKHNYYLSLAAYTFFFGTRVCLINAWDYKYKS